MKRLIATLAVCAALVSAALGQVVASPQIGVTRRSDVLNKTIANMAYHTVTIGNATFTRAVDESPTSLVLVKGQVNRLEALLSNAVVTNCRYALLPSGTDGLKSKNEKTSDSNNKSRKVFELGWEELDVLKLQKNQAMFTGELKLDGARLGPNVLFCRAETKHANHTDVALPLIATISSTDWRRNFLNDPVPVLVVASPRGAADYKRLVVMLKQHGYFCSDLDVDDDLTAMVKDQTVPATQVVEDRGQKAEDRNRDHEVDTSKLDAPALKISIGAKTVDGEMVCDFRKEPLKIDAGGSFQLRVYRVERDGSEKLVKDKSYPDSPLLLDLSGTDGREYRFEVIARGQLVGTFTLKETK
ncbi:MAG: hypothetical protein AAB613_01000 [Patescibacteria group bacterium]